MNAAKLLGGLLKNRSGSSGGGGGLLKDLITGVLQNRAGGSAPAPQADRGAPRSGGPDLGDLVRDAYSKFQTRRGGATKGSDCNDPAHRNLGGSGRSELDNKQAVVLIRAMINAAKSDGQLDQRVRQLWSGQAVERGPLLAAPAVVFLAAPAGLGFPLHVDSLGGEFLPQIDHVAQITDGERLPGFSGLVHSHLNELITPILLLFAVMFWVAGFDIIYALHDFEFDRKHNLYSIPETFPLLFD